MKTAYRVISIRSFTPIFLIMALRLWFPPAAHAGLTLEMNVVRYDQYGYEFYPYLNTNAALPGVPFGNYYITSLDAPTNGASAFYQYTTNGFNQSGGITWGYGDFNSMLHELTNGNWAIFVTNSVTTNVYHFTVTANISSNDLPLVTITFPANGALNVTNQPAFTWQGPTNYGDLVVYEYNNSSYLPVTQTSWPSPRTLYLGLNNFTAHYDSNSTTAVVSSIPRDNSSNSISSWVSTTHLQDFASSQFTVGTVDPSGTSHTLVAHYPWDITNNDGTASGVDTSGNGYDMNFGGGFGGQGGVSSTIDPAAGPRAVEFHNGDGNSAGYVGWNPTPAGLLTALSGSFSISCWIKTTQTGAGGWDQAPAYYGAGIVSADNGGQANDVIPLALTGSKIGFNTGGDAEDVTLNSSASVNDGNYHHIVVTRNQQTGQKIIYIDGVLDSFSSGTTNLLKDPQKLTIGALADASDSNADDFNYYNGYDGELDDLQIYSGVLSSGEVASLFANPGSTVANGVGFSGGHKNVAHYTFDNSGNLGQDTSGNGNDMPDETWWGPQHQSSADAEAGVGAIQFFGTDAISPDGQVLTNLNAVLAGSFTFSAWVKTTVTNGADYNNAFYGGVIFWAYNDQGNTNDTIPLSITGSKAAFTTRDHLGNFDTLHSSSSVNDGNYHLITVTRDQSSGEKKIYVDGHFESSEIGTTDPLNGNNYNLTIGGWAYYTDGTGTNFSSYNGLLDDVQIYSGILSDAEVASLYANPGSTVPDVIGGSPGGPVVHYDFDEGTVLAADVSGNNNNVVYAGNFGGSGPDTSSDAVAGSGSVSFDGGSYLTASPNLLPTLAGSFTISLWVKTTQDNGDPNDLAWTGDAIISADIPYAGANDLIPVALTGGQVAFNTANTQYNYDDTINSSTLVNDGQWHHVVVSRNQPSGEKFIYIDGVLDTSDVDATNLLNDPQLLTIGCKADASNPDPTSPDSTGENGYQGLLDDVQIYDRVLTPGEVAFLHNNPGTTLAGVTNPPSPVSVEFSLSISRQQEQSGFQIYIVQPIIDSISPIPVTTNRVEAPDGNAFSEVWPGNSYDINGGNGWPYASLDSAIYACTNGQWTLYINKGDPSQQVFHFNVSVNGLTTNLLAPVKISVPTNNAVNVATNTPFQWSGPTNFSYVNVYAYQLSSFVSIGSALLATDATNWPSPPAMPYGTNEFSATYTLLNSTNITLSTPEDDSMNPVSEWTPHAYVYTVSGISFVVGAPAPLPVLITNIVRTGANLQFSFQTLAGRPHTVQSRTNLLVGTWIDLTNFTGDGSMRQFSFQTTNPPAKYFRVKTQ